LDSLKERKTKNMVYNITLIPGDGIGSDVSTAARRCVDATGVKINWEVKEAGADVIEIITNQEPPNIKWLNAPISSADNSGVLVKLGKKGTYYDKA